MRDEINREAENTASKTLSVAAGATAGGKGGTNPLHPAVESKTPESSTESPETDLNNEAGGEG